MQSREQKAFQRQKWSAGDRGIDFKFSFAEWCAWWENKLGPGWMKLRGRTKGKYHMARLGDVGAYETANVKCITISENSAEKAHTNFGDKNGAAKLTPAQVIEARMLHAAGSRVSALARKYNVAHGTIGPCLRGETWRDAKFGWTGSGDPKRERAA